MKKWLYLLLLLFVANFITYCTKSEDLNQKQIEAKLPSGPIASERAACTTGDCNWTVEVRSVSPAGSLWAFDITRYLCDYDRCVCDIFDCENLFTSGSHSIGVQYNFPIEHTSRLEIEGLVYNSSGSIISGSISIRVRKAGVATPVDFTINSSTGAPAPPINVVASCPFLTIPGCNNTPPGGGGGDQ